MCQNALVAYNLNNCGNQRCMQVYSVQYQANLKSLKASFQVCTKTPVSVVQELRYVDDCARLAHYL